MAETRPSIGAKQRTFRQLHESGCFLIPNPWDVGTARYLQGLGFKALATTSSGFGWSKGRPDAAKPRDMALAHLCEMVSATDLPVNADFESGFAHDAAGVAESVRLAVETRGCRACRSRMRPAMQPSRSMTSAPRSTGFAPHAEPSTRRVAIPCWSGAPNAFWWVDPISMKQSAG